MREERPLTKVQLQYLDIIVTRGRLHRNWGGFGSTQTVRILEERGYIRLIRGPRNEWVAKPLDKAREAVLKMWEELHPSTQV